MSEKMNKLIKLAEKAKEMGHYALALKYLNIAAELAEQANDQEALMKCLSLINSITKLLRDQKQKLTKKTQYSLGKQIDDSRLYSLLTGAKYKAGKKEEKARKTSEFERTLSRVEQSEDWGEITPQEEKLKEISDDLKELKGSFFFDRVSTVPDTSTSEEPVTEISEKRKEAKSKKARKKEDAEKQVPEVQIPDGFLGGLPTTGGAGGAPPKKPAMKPPGAPALPSAALPPRPPTGPPKAAPPSTKPPRPPAAAGPGAPLPPPSEEAAPEPSPQPISTPSLRRPIAPSQPTSGMEMEEEADETLAGDELAEFFDEAREGRATAEKEAKPKKIKRFGDVSSPMEMTVQKEYLVNIGLRVFKEDVVGMPVPMTITVPAAGPPIIEVLVMGRDFKIDQPRRSLVVPMDTDSDILNYRITPTKEGIGSITVEFYQEGTLIGRAILKIVVKKKKEPVNEALSSTSVTVASSFGDTRLDATLRIIRYENDFFFSLFTPRAKAVVSQSALFGKATVNMSKVHKLEVLMEQAVFDRANPLAALDRLRELGTQIYDSIPKQIRNTIQSIEPKYLMIETGDLLVPWELAFDGDDFLCSKYCLGKRVFDETRDFRPPPFCIGKKILDVIFIGASPKNVPEISVKEEVELFDVYEQTKRIHLQKFIEPDALKAKVIEVLGQGDVVHLTCHGHFEEEKPLDSALLLSDDILTADELDDMDLNNWPLIFANACSTGAISDKIVGIGGIARSFLEAGAIAFLGPLFEIPDDIAIEFAKDFYNNLFYNNENLGEAILNTRKKLRDQFGGAFWAIFSLYGDPTLNLCKA